MSSTSHPPTTVSLADEEAVRRIVVDTLFGLWATVNNLTRLRPSRHERYRVTVFGSARTEPGHWVYEEVKQMCSALSAMGCDIITGGGPGLMQAANEGARAAQASQGAQSIGIRVHLPFEQEVNPFVQQAFEHATFFTRLHHFVLVSDAYIVAPGGLGTVLESMMIWQLLQEIDLTDRQVVGGPPVRINQCRSFSDSAVSILPPMSLAVGLTPTRPDERANQSWRHSRQRVTIAPPDPGRRAVACEASDG
jgi:predicted Rossmann-fold nucleotide-binding protein